MPGSPEAHPCLLSRGSDTSPVSQRLHTVALRSVEGGYSRQEHSSDTWAVCLWGPLSLHGPGCTGISGGGGWGRGRWELGDLWHEEGRSGFRAN